MTLTERPAAAVTALGFLTWDRDDPTGGNVYSQALVTELRGLGIDVHSARSSQGLGRTERLHPPELSRASC